MAELRDTHLGDTKIFDGRDGISCTSSLRRWLVRSERKRLTSKVKLPFLDGVDVRRDGLDELGRELEYQKSEIGSVARDGLLSE